MNNVNASTGIIPNQSVLPIQPPINFKKKIELVSAITGGAAAGIALYDRAEKAKQSATSKARKETKYVQSCMEFTRQNNADFEANRITSYSWASNEIFCGMTKAKTVYPKNNEICNLAIPIPKKVNEEDISRVHEAVIQVCPTTDSQIGNRAQSSTKAPLASASIAIDPRPLLNSKMNPFNNSAFFSIFIVSSVSFCALVLKDLVFPPKQNQKQNQKDNLFDFSYKFQLEERLEKIEKQLEKTSLFSITLQLSEKIETGTLTKEKAESLLRKFSFSEDEISFILS